MIGNHKDIFEEEGEVIYKEGLFFAKDNRCIYNLICNYNYIQICESFNEIGKKYLNPNFK